MTLIGDKYYYSRPYALTSDEYLHSTDKVSLYEYNRRKREEGNKTDFKDLVSQIQFLDKILSPIFGINKVKLNVQGSVELTLVVLRKSIGNVGLSTLFVFTPNVSSTDPCTFSFTLLIPKIGLRILSGAEKQEFELSAHAYEANKHFFLSKYFRDTYDASLSRLPVINSGVTITKIEVWVTNKSSRFEQARNIVAFVDLGENGANTSNSMWLNLSFKIYSEGSSNRAFSTFS